MKKLIISLALLVLLPYNLYADVWKNPTVEDVRIEGSSTVEICSGTGDVKLSTGCGGAGTIYSITLDATDGSFDLPAGITVDDIAASASSDLTLSTSGGSTDVILNGKDDVLIKNNGITNWSFRDDSALAYSGSGAGKIFLGSGDAILSATTSDGSDTATVSVCGGGTCAENGTRGAELVLDGNETSGGGDVRVFAGDASYSAINLYAPASNGIITFAAGNIDTDLTIADNVITIASGTDVNAGSAGGSSFGSTTPFGVYYAGNGTITTLLSYSSGNGTGVIGTTTAHDLELRVNNTEELFLSDDVLEFADTTSNDVKSIRVGTSAADDDANLQICAAGSCTVNDGAKILMSGNEASGSPGDLVLSAGDVSGGEISFFQSGLETFKVVDASSASLLQYLNGGMGIYSDTADGSDNASIQLSGGGALNSSSRGALININGNEAAGGPDLELYAGGASGGNVTIGTTFAGQTVSLTGGASGTDLTIADNLITVAAGTELKLLEAATSSGVLCTKSDGNIGQCTSAVGAGGTCTCG